MNISIDINVKASKEVTNALITLATVLNSTASISHKEKTENNAKDVQTEEEKSKQGSEETKVTLEQVRAKLAQLSQDGKQAQVKALIKKFGAKKLTDIPAEKYSELMQEAEVL